MMCGCGQNAYTTHACPVLVGPLCFCGKPIMETHVHWDTAGVRGRTDPLVDPAPACDLVFQAEVNP